MRYIPNIISLSRLAGAVVLIFSYRNPVRFLLVYLYCGVSDLVDGWLARRFGLMSTSGAKLDSLADFVFLVVSMCSLIFCTDILQRPLILMSITLVFCIRLHNLLTTHRKFLQWGALHTLGNKLTTAALFFAVLVCNFTGLLPLVVVAPVIALALLSALEESYILKKSSEYNPDVRSAKAL
jgi:CDP-diacylglycerol--glycerol-3-phosphate 3-phosphatidyltransferase